MGSRQELIAWVNDLLQTSYTKVEQFGTGAAYCQIVDSVYGDVRLDRVKFDANQEYEYMENFKILQNAFTKHKVDKPLDPTRLMKCRFQDNFELIQWLKRFWDQNFPGMAYDAVERRKGKPAGPVDVHHRPMSSSSSARSSSAGAYRARPGGGPGGSRVAGGRPAAVGAGVRGVAQQRPGSRPMAGAGASTQQVQELNRQLADAKVLIDTAEKERDFYFSKLREIEVFIQQSELEPGTEVEAMAKRIQAVLYSTEEGTVDDIDAQEDPAAMQYEQQAGGHMNSHHVDEEETF
ncbi:microtubule integrity protein mal3 [Coemansia sp. RSA 1813]|nr:microtubule integrity protein mal3 [Coemansia sp. RSA 1646]KAJ1770475.1 microtubule integrity protein mal3 [Coemansia sp. RSA 1843]KAJ2088168.1 microtubule integrity protein mal3 [Coemansia sp. RSA 986]KAJ2212178.1 microtubule integrity protein mal3 [Coemansia sp. RSA 487]KAJ2568012.1 microtubule integrity protein mal3 [Coemansia sp. RSA 1813]